MTETLNQVENQAAIGNYADAIVILEDANKQISNTVFTTTIKDYQEKSDIAFLQKAKSQFTKDYDNIDKVTRYKPKNSTVGRNRNIYPIISICDDDSKFAILGLIDFYIQFGFQQSDWLFLDQVLVDCDGEQFTYKFSYFDSDNIVLYGGDILEWCLIYHDEVFSDGTHANLADLVNLMATAKVVTVRFSGDSGRKDVVIPSAHIKEVETMWKMYEIINRNKSLASYIK